MKWYTCTPVSFKGDHTFFSRDSGAFCKAFLKQHTWNLASRGRRKHLDSGDMVTFPIPSALQSVADREWLYGKSIVRKLALVPPPFLPPAALQERSATSLWP